MVYIAIQKQDEMAINLVKKTQIKAHKETQARSFLFD